MAALRIYNVRGDGNCYYRCIWRIIKDDDELRADLGIAESIRSEDDAVPLLRNFVANRLETDETAQTMLRNVWELSACIADIDEQYPLAAKVARYKNWETVLNNACRLIRTTSIMASELEHKIISHALDDLHVVVLARMTETALADSAEQWLHQLNILLPRIEKGTVALLINEDYIHYKYMKFQKEVVISTDELESYVQQMLNNDTDTEL
jgi:hypothetical protein